MSARRAHLIAETTFLLAPRKFLLVVLSLILLCFVGIVPSSANSQSARSAADFNALDAYIQAELRANQISGAAFVFIQDGSLVYTQGYGEAGPGRPMPNDTPMFIGSVSKSFTAVAVLQLVEAGKVDLDAPVRAYLPWFTLADSNAAAKITVRHLLNQTSGLVPAGLPYLIFSQAGMTALQLTLGYYHADFALLILLTALASLALSIARALRLLRPSHP